MRKLISTLLLMWLIAFANANNQSDLVFKNLMSVNAEWKNQKDVAPILAHGIAYNQNTFTDWIATHLMLVEKTLRARDVNSLSLSQKNNRYKLLNELNGYWKAKSFPVNNYLLYKNPVFIDRKGTHCAVGYLMMQSGNDDLAQAINTQEKFAYVHEIKTEGVKQWADENGFTVNELAWIQPGYPPNTVVQDMEGGLNGTVNAIAVDGNNQTVYAAGNFSASQSGTTCNNIAAWISGFAGYDWISVGNGLNGTVHALLIQNNKLYAGGEFTMAGAVYATHIAVYDISTGQWQAMGTFDSTVRALAIYNNEIYAGGNFSGFVSKWTGSAWQDITQGFIYGEGVRTLEVWNNELVIGGSFELATGALRKHIAGYDGTYMTSLGFGTTNPVNDLEVHNGILFAACDVVSGTDTCALASFENFNWIVRVKGSNEISSYFSGNSINHLSSANGQLLAAGDFSCGSGITYGSNLAQLSPALWGDTSQYDCIPLIFTDQPIHTLASQLNTIYFGGDFIHAMGDTASHIAYLQMTITELPSQDKGEISIGVSPNPVSDMIHVVAKNQEPILATELIDVNGRKITAQNSADTKNISVAQLPTGVYMLWALTKSGWSSSRFVKE